MHNQPAVARISVLFGLIRGALAAKNDVVRTQSGAPDTAGRERLGEWHNLYVEAGGLQPGANVRSVYPYVVDLAK